MAVEPAGSVKKPEPKKEEKELPVSLVRKKAINALRFSPRAWAKLIWLRDRGNTEISVFGVSRLTDLLYVEDVKIIKQVASVATFDFDEAYLNHYLVDMVQAGHQPCEVFRIWIHTHPGGASPSGVDIETFDRTTKNADWGVMCIVGKDDAKYARLRLRVSDGAIAVDVELDVKVDWSGEFVGVANENAQKWNAEYKECVSHRVVTPHVVVGGHQGYRQGMDCGWYDAWDVPYGEPEYPGDSGFLPEKEADCPSHDADDGIDDDFGAQKVYLIEQDGSGDTIVYTEDYWFQYDGTPELKVTAEMEVTTPRSICDESPQFWGEVDWDPEDAKSFAIRVSIHHNGSFIPLTKPEAADNSVSADAPEKEEEEPQSESVGP